VKKVYYFLFLLILIPLIVSCSSTSSNKEDEGVDEGISVKTYLISSDLQAVFQQKGVSRGIKSQFIDGNYITTPTHFSGRLLTLNFQSDSAIDPTDTYFPPDKWVLRGIDGSEEEQIINIGTVFFDLRSPHEVSKDLAQPPSAIGYGIYKSLFLNYTYVDVSFEFDGTIYSVRICTSNRDGCTRGDIMMKDSDGIYKWISKSGDPNTLISSRPDDPVINDYLAGYASGWAGGDTTATIFITEAHIPEEYRFDVPSVSGSYEITLDFDLTNIILLEGIDPSNYTKRDVLEKLYLWNFVGKSDGNHLIVIPTVIYNGNSSPVADAGSDQSIYVGSDVTLDGSGSYDPDNDPLTYTWSFDSMPDGSTAILNGSNSVNSSFTPDVVGDYIVSLVVNDGTLNSAPDTVTITVLPLE